MDIVGIRVYDTVEKLLNALVSVEASKLNMKRRKEILKAKAKSKFVLRVNISNLHEASLKLKSCESDVDSQE